MSLGLKNLWDICSTNFFFAFKSEYDVSSVFVIFIYLFREGLERDIINKEIVLGNLFLVFFFSYINNLL